MSKVVRFYKQNGDFSYEKDISEITAGFCQSIKATHFFHGGYCYVDGKRISSHNTLQEVVEKLQNESDVAFTLVEDETNEQEKEAIFDFCEDVVRNFGYIPNVIALEINDANGFMYNWNQMMTALTKEQRQELMRGCREYRR